MSNDTDREALANLIWTANAASGWSDTDSAMGFVADAILTEFLPAYTERIRAEQRETDAQIAASNLDRPWVASETPGDIARAIQAGGIDG